MKNIAILLILSFCLISTKAQSLTDSIVVVKNTYQGHFFSDTPEELYHSDKIKITSKRKISDLISKLSQFDSEGQLLLKFGIDTSYILNHSKELLKLYDGHYKIDWNEKQTKFIFEKLKDFNSYRSIFKGYLSRGCCYTMHDPYRYDYVIKLYSNNKMINIYTSNKSIWGYNIPYRDGSNRFIYNYEIDKQLNKLFKRKIKLDEPLKGNDLLKYIVNQITENNIRELYKLSAYSYEKEISELSTDFSIISSEEVYGRGRYIWDEPKTIKITLKNEFMLPNVYVQFLDSKYGETLYSRDSIKKDFKEIVNRVQSIPFITNYVKRDTDAHLDIYYFNNSGINKYNIDGINKNPTEWKKQEDYIKSLNWYEEKNIKPSFDLEKAIKTSERINCGCNFRFDYDFIKKAIFIEITSNKNTSSIWFLLPNDNMLLYHVEAYHLEILDIHLNKFGNKIQLPFACLLFDKNGNLIENK